MPTAKGEPFTGVKSPVEPLIWKVEAVLKLSLNTRNCPEGSTKTSPKNGETAVDEPLDAVTVPVRISTAYTEMFPGDIANKKLPVLPKVIDTQFPTGKGDPCTTVSELVRGSTAKE